MKKILIALAVVLAVQVADAQVKTPAVAAKSLEAAKNASQDAKKATKVATWLKLADAYIDAYNAPAGLALRGTSKQELQLYMGSEKPLSSETIVLDSTPFLKEVYENKNLYFNENGVLQIIEITKPVVDDPLAGALEAYAQAYAVDVKKSKTDDIARGIEDISKKYFDDGLTKYNLEEVAAAQKLFEKSAHASKVAPLSKIDTVALYYAAFSAWQIQDYPKAKDLFEKCLEAEYYANEGEVFAKLSDIYDKLGDKESSKLILEQGFQSFPQNQGILIGLINYYIANNEDPARLFKLISLAKENEPNNSALYRVEGDAYLELCKADPSKTEEYRARAVQAYDDCIRINPKDVYGYTSKGVMYFNIALDLQEKAAAELDDAKWMQLTKQFDEALKSAIKPFEDAYAIAEDNGLKVNIAEYLKNIYYRFSSESDEYMNAYRKYDEVVKTGKAI